MDPEEQKAAAIAATKARLAKEREAKEQASPASEPITMSAKAKARRDTQARIEKKRGYGTPEAMYAAQQAAKENEFTISPVDQKALDAMLADIDVGLGIDKGMVIGNLARLEPSAKKATMNKLFSSSAEERNKLLLALGSDGAIARGVAGNPAEVGLKPDMVDPRKAALQNPLSIADRAVNAVGRGVTSITGELPQAGDIDEKLSLEGLMGGPGGLATAPLQAVLGVLDTLQNRDHRVGDIAPVTTAGNAALDVASIGLANTVRGGIDMLEKDVNPDGAWEAWTEESERRALEQEEIRAANPGVAMATDVVTSIGTGGAIAKGMYETMAKYAPKVAKAVGQSRHGRVLFGSGVGGTEVAAYRMNKDGDLEQALVDGSLAALGGVVLGGLFEGTKGLWSIIRNTKSPDVIEESVGGEILRMIDIEQQGKGLPPATASSVMKSVQELGPDATLLDAFPSLKQFAMYVLRNEDAAMSGAGLRNILSTRNGLMEDLMAPDGLLREVFKAKTVRGYKTFSEDVAKRFSTLQPRFSEVIKQNAGVRFAGKPIVAAVQKLFGDKTRRTAAQTDLLSAISGNIEKYKALGKKVKDAKGKLVYPDQLTLEQATDLKQVLQRAAGEKALRIAGTDRTLPLDNLGLRDLAKVQGYLADLIHNKVPELAPLDKVYGSVASLKSAYKAGEEMFTKSAADSADITMFLNDPKKSAAAKRAFVEGAKYRVFKMLNKAKDAKGIDKVITDNREVFQRMEALFGKDQVAAMVEAIRPSVTKLKTAEALNKAIPRLEKAEGRNTNFGSTIDMATVVGGVPGVVSKAGLLGAFRRLFGQAVDPKEVAQKREMYGSILSKMGDGASDAFRGLEEIMNRSIRPSDKASIRNAGGLAVATGQDLGAEENSDGELPQ